MAKHITLKEEKRIVEAIESGKSINQVGKEFKRSPSTIQRIMKKNGIKTEYSINKKAAEARSYFCKEERMNLLRKGFEKANELLENATEYRDFKDWSMAVAILIDKQRLEEGEPTEINKSDVKNNNVVTAADLSKKDIETLAEEIRKERELSHKIR